jgi:hypothetical protein
MYMYSIAPLTLLNTDFLFYSCCCLIYFKIVCGVHIHSEHHFSLSDAHRQYAATAVNHEQLYVATGSIDTMQVLPCGSIAKPGSHLNGTRLSLSRNKDEGYDFFICSASTRARTQQFHEEHDAAFRRLEAALLKWYELSQPQASASASASNVDHNEDGTLRESKLAAAKDGERSK